MSKPTDRKKNKPTNGKKTKLTENEKRIGEVISKHRNLLNQEIAKIDPSIVVELAVGPHIGDEIDITRFFSDWPDTWNDGGRWVKTWGKGGGDLELKPLEELRRRLTEGRLKRLIK